MDINNYKINPKLVDYLDSKKITDYTPVQHKVIPLLLKSNQVVVEAPTGTGKTLAFLLPIITKMKLEEQTLQYVIFVPTRELGKQIHDVLLEIKKYLPIKTLLATGGEDIKEQMSKTKIQPQILIATANRFEKLAKESILDFSNLKYITVDEADMVINFGFINQILKLFTTLNIPENVVWSLFSATFPLEVKNFIKNQIKGKVENVTETQVNNTIDNAVIDIQHYDKDELMINLLKADIFNPFLCLIFVNSNKDVDKVFNLLKENGIKQIAKYTSDMTPRERKQIMTQVQSEKIVYLITTDAVSRGIDFVGVSHIINYNLPADLTYYRHRVGRTNRNNIVGVVYTFITSNEKREIDKLEKINPFINFKKVKKIEELWKD